ncbi:MAG TPA: hypothetical protein VE861_02060 [Gemmatimonadaceae bacterium]|nr:hypothetical protein [Gemmatimonadaceae bacterium]
MRSPTDLERGGDLARHESAGEDGNDRHQRRKGGGARRTEQFDRATEREDRQVRSGSRKEALPAPPAMSWSA